MISPTKTLFFVFFTIVILESLHVTSPSELEGFYNTPVLTNYPLKGKFESITGQLVSNDAKPEDKVGKIVIIYLSENGISWNTEEARQVEQGAIGIIDVDRSSDISGNIVYLYSANEEANRAKVTVPIVTLGKKDGAKFKEILASGMNITVNITCDDPNPWVEAFTSVYYNIFFVGYLSIFSFVCFERALLRLVKFVSRLGCKFQIAQFTLFIHCLTNLIRLMIILVDPVHSRGILSWQFASIWHTITLPLGLMATLSLTLFWHETITRKLSNAAMTFLKKFQIPFIITCTIILLLDIGGSILRAMYFPFILISVIEIGLFNLIIISITIFYFITGCKILKQLNKSKNVRRGKSRSANVTKLVVLSSVGNITVCIGSLLLGLDAFNTPFLYIGAWFVFHTGMLITSIIQILAFVPPPKTGDQTSSMGNNSYKVSNKFATE